MRYYLPASSISGVLMRAARRALHVAVLLLTTTAVRAQTASPIDSRLQDLLSRTKAGHEQEVDQVNTAFGQRFP